MIPGSKEFRVALLATLRREPRIRTLGPPEIHTEERVSRNTVIYRCRAGSTRLVAKAQLTKSADVAAAEYHMLREMDETLGNGRIRGLRPVALLKDLGVLVTEEEDGETLRSVIEQALDSSTTSWNRARAGVQAAADALRLFHDRSPGRVGRSPHPNGKVRSYMDFSSRNILVRWADPGIDQPEVVLMDPPEEERWGERTDDIGMFCFDLARIRFLPGFVLRPSVSKALDRLKAWFIRSYFGPVGLDDLEDRLKYIALAERERAQRVLGWYLRPWRYDPMLPEIARLLYLGPLTLTYLVGGSRLSALRVRAIVRNQSDVGS